MIVLHLLNTNTFSGAENVACQIIRLLSSVENCTSYYCSLDGPISGVLKEKGINFVPIIKNNPFNLKKVLTKINPTTIHAHDMYSCLIATLSTNTIPIVGHIHNNSFDSRRISFKSLGFLFASFKLKHIFWVSQNAMDGFLFKSIVRKKSSVLRNVIDKDELEKKAESDTQEYHFDIIFLGRLSFEKNPKRFLEIVSRVVNTIPSLSVAIVGDGTLRNDLEQFCKNNGVEKNVKFFGFQTNPYKILKNSKILVMTSLWEGLPMCVLEAMSFGIPVVSTPTDGIKEVISNNINGITSDKNEVLIQEITSLIVNKEKYNLFSQNQIVKFNEICNLQKYKSKVLEFYE